MGANKPQPEHIHTPGDGRGRREVFVNGKKITRCFYADTKKGIADAHGQPLKLHRYGKRFIARRHRGKVTINFLNNPEQEPCQTA